MASDNMDKLEEKIHKIRLQNEEIRRRHEEVEADKKYAAKQNALVQMVPSDDWPERKEPPEFSSPPKNLQRQKSNKEHSDRVPQHYSSIQERLGKKDHKFTQGDGPPPDPKYNFLADSEREMRGGDDGRVDDEKNRGRNKTPRGGSRRRGGGVNTGGGSRDAFFKDNRGPQAFHSKEESLPEYEAWRAERNRIDEARINRQKTAEGNWRREWDSNKTHIEKDSSRKGESNRKDSNMYERRSNHYDSDFSNRGHGGSRTYHGSQKNHGHQDYRRPHHEQSHEYKRQQDNKPPLSPSDDRTVIASDKSIKVTVNPSQPKGPVMSVKVNSPSIAGTGRVGPRQKSRVTYSSQSDAEGITQEYNNFSRQKSFDEKTAGTNFNNGPRSAPKSPFTQRKKEGNSKSPYSQRKEFRNDESSARSKNPTKSPYSQKIESKDQKHTNSSASKPQRNQKRNSKLVGDALENVTMFNDNALPAEYQPDKSSNNVRDLRVNDDDNVKNISNIVNDEDQGSFGASKDLKSFVMSEKSINEIVSSCDLEDDHCKNKLNNDSIEEILDCKESVPKKSNNNDNNQIYNPETENSQKNNSDFEKTAIKDESQSVLELINDQTQVLDLSNVSQETILQDIAVDEVTMSSNTREIILQDPIVEQDSKQMSSNTQETIVQDTAIEQDSKQICSSIQETILQDTAVEQDSTQLSSNTQETILQDTAVEQDSRQLSDSTQETILQDTVVEQESTELSCNTQETILQDTAVEQDSTQLSSNTQETILQETAVEQDSTQLSSNTQETILQKTAVEQDSTQLSSNTPETILHDTALEQDSTQLSSNTPETILQDTALEQDSTQLSSNTPETILQDSAVDQSLKLSSKVVEETALAAIANDDLEIQQEISKKENFEEIKLVNVEEKKNSESMVHNDSQKIDGQLKDLKSQEYDSISKNEKNKLIDEEKNSLEKPENSEIDKEPIKINETVLAESETSQNESINDSGIKDTSILNESIELNDTEITETSSQYFSANDSGVIDESNEIKTQTMAPVNFSIVSDNTHNVEKDFSESIKFVEPTKEICEKTAESCDISSAASSESLKTVIDNAEENDDYQDAIETLENRTKDSGVDIVEAVNKIESPKINDLEKDNVSEKENPEMKESMKVGTE